LPDQLSAQLGRTHLSSDSVTAKFVFGNWQSTKKVDFLMPVLESGYGECLFLAAQCYLGLGYSVIPVYGNLDIERAKVCPIPWSCFQQRRATNNDLRTWFTKLGYGGVAIVTGRISSLVVLDFDDLALASDFARHFPDLTETWTVESGNRKLPHYYYRLPHNLNVSSQKRDGVDLQSGGRYIITPPTATTIMEWRTVRGGQPKMLLERDFRRISAFMGTTSLENDTNPLLFAFLGISKQNVQPVSHLDNATTLPPGPIKIDNNELPDLIPPAFGDVNKLTARYLKLAPAGRNEALFQTAIWARDHGWHKDDVKHCVVSEHVHRVSTREHPNESPEQRRREAICTVESAYSRPPRTVLIRNDSKNEQGNLRRTFYGKGIISNNIREELLRRKDTATLRVLEALTLAGYQPGHIFTEGEARVTARQYAVGDWSVRKALRQAAFFTPPTRDPSESANLVDTAINTEDTEYKKCFFVNQPKPTKIQTKGRPKRYYMMPNQETLCASLDVQAAPASRANPDDLRSVRSYRQSVLRELIRRRPGRYSRNWLAELMGISVTTTRRYTKDLEFEVSPTYHECLLLWQNVDSLIPPDIQDTRPGTFLEDSQGKRYPPVRQIAQRLLRKMGVVHFKWRGVNHYGYAKSASAITGESEIGPPVIKCDLPIPERCMLPIPPPPIPNSAEKPPLKYASPLADPRLEATARRVYDNVGQLDGKRILSLANARALVTDYGEVAVENTLAYIKTRDNIRHPVGLLKRLLSQKYGFMTDEALTIAEIYVAELAFRVTREINPGRALSWPNACKLARQYGQIAIERAVMTLRERQVENPAGFLIKLLESDPSLGNPHAGKPNEQFVEYVYNTLRQMNPQKALSRKLVYRLIAARGHQAVTNAMHLIKQRGNVQNPAGFLVTVLRAHDVMRKRPDK
jgi:hypothetical protein